MDDGRYISLPAANPSANLNMNGTTNPSVAARMNGTGLRIAFQSAANPPVATNGTNQLFYPTANPSVATHPSGAGLTFSPAANSSDTMHGSGSASSSIANPSVNPSMNGTGLVVAGTPNTTFTMGGIAYKFVSTNPSRIMNGTGSFAPVAGAVLNGAPSRYHSGVDFQLIQQQQRKSTEELLKERTGIYVPLIANRRDLERRRREHRAMHDKDMGRDASLDADFPQIDSPEEEQCIHQLYIAMINTEGCIEKETQWQRKRVALMSDLEIQFIAMDILDAVRHAHCGKLGFPKRHWNKEWGYRSYDTFTARFNDVLAVCRISKSIVYGDAPVSYAGRVASAPLKEIDSKDANTIINQRRKREIDAGKMAMRAQEEPSEEASPKASAPGALADAELTAPKPFAFEFPPAFGGMKPLGQPDANVDVSHLFDEE
ncbi:hypothetical protein B0T14DRAFT_567608 [Immersiella caudata]|uniref:Uncharacterized protein n=1 Tax=Immersiella caudata TaxID=314043 RepID=A0AA39WSQ7_9PEZI|nr:hypothetical protein B0T14DRAFT_567608 [Immersiella caudata]